MATKPKSTKPDLLKESLSALKAVKELNLDWDDHKEDDPPMWRAFQRVKRVLNKAAKLKAA
jgi:hypothetical protein